MRTIAEITKYCVETCNKVNVVFNVPVELNGRLKTTLGRCHFTCNNVTGRCYPTKLDFSKNFIEGAADADILHVVNHELAHYIVTYRTHEKHGHDEIFKKACKELNEDSDGCYLKSEAAAVTPNFKYQARCSKCGKVVGQWMRAGKIVKNPELFHTNCCKADFTIEQLY